MKLINLTPHEVVILTGDEKIILQPADEPARAEQRDKEIGVIINDDELNQIPIVKSEFGEVENLPQPKEGVGYIVSRVVAEACKKRDDLYIPAQTVRNDKGQIIGCKALAKV